jgi:hypothetical protein
MLRGLSRRSTTLPAFRAARTRTRRSSVGFTRRPPGLWLRTNYPEARFSCNSRVAVGERPSPTGTVGYDQETWDLTILEATGIYTPYVGGHNHMVDQFHPLNGDFLTNPNSPGLFDENCYCILSVTGSLPLWWTSN